MKKILFTLFLILVHINFGLSEGRQMGYTTFKNNALELIKNIEFEKLIHAVRIVESGLNDLAVGSAQDVGPLQITLPRLTDYNQRTGKNYSHNDCFKWEVSKEIFLFYAERIGIEKSNWAEISRRWNRSSKWQDEKGQQYWNKVINHLN